MFVYKNIFGFNRSETKKIKLKNFFLFMIKIIRNFTLHKRCLISVYELNNIKQRKSSKYFIDSPSKI